MTTYIIILFIIAAVALAFAYGYRRGKKSRKIDLAGLSMAQALAWMLDHEILRHQQDIENIRKDRAKINVYTPHIPLDLWIEVK